MIAALLAVTFGFGGPTTPPRGCVGEGLIVLAYGDSKTVPQVGASNNQEIWQDFFERRGCSAKLNLGAGGSYKPGSIADNGITTEERAATIAADIAGVSRSPNVILYNLGSNDAFFNDAEAVDEAAWKANLATVWDAMHVAWPSAAIWYSETWRQGFDAESDRLATWYAAVAAGRSYVHLCDNERDWVKGSDDGATMFWDGIHFSRAGAAEKARRAAACLGF